MRDYALSRTSESSCETQRLENKTMGISVSSNESCQDKKCDVSSVDDKCSHFPVFSEAEQQTSPCLGFTSTGFKSNTCSCNSIKETQEVYRPTKVCKHFRKPTRNSQDNLAEGHDYESLIPHPTRSRNKNSSVSFTNEDVTDPRYINSAGNVRTQRSRRFTESEFLDCSQNQNNCSSGLRQSYTTPLFHSCTCNSNPYLSHIQPHVCRSCQTVQTPTHCNVSPASTPSSQYNQQAASRLGLNRDTKQTTGQSYSDDTYIRQGNGGCSCVDKIASNKRFYILCVMNIVMLILISFGFPYLFFVMRNKEQTTSTTALSVFQTPPPCKKCDNIGFTTPSEKEDTGNGLPCCAKTFNEIKEIAREAMKEKETLGRPYFHAEGNKIGKDDKLLLDLPSASNGIDANGSTTEIKTNGYYFIYGHVTLRLEQSNNRSREGGTVQASYRLHKKDRNNQDVEIHKDNMECMRSSNPISHSLFSNGIFYLQNNEKIYATVKRINSWTKDSQLDVAKHSLGLLFIAPL